MRAESFGDLADIGQVLEADMCLTSAPEHVDADISGRITH